MRRFCELFQPHPPTPSPISERGMRAKRGGGEVNRGVEFNLGVCVLLFLISACTLRLEQIETLPESTEVAMLPTALHVPPPTPTPHPDPVAQHVRQIFTVGQVLGNQPDVFAKVGDSITVADVFLSPIGEGLYDLTDEYAHLQSVIDHYSAAQVRAGSINSFNNSSLAAGVGWSAFAALDRAYAPPGCTKTPLECEYEALKPSVALIMFGTNDVGYRSTEEYRADLKRLVETSLQMGVIPVLSTIPPRPDIPHRVTQFNTVVSEITASYQIPLWDYYTPMLALPNSGLTFDLVHPSSPPNRYGGAADFHPQNLRYGYVVRNLTALQTLHSVLDMLPIAQD